MVTKDEAGAHWAKQRALIDQQRKEARQATVRLVRAEDEPPLFSDEYQTEFRNLRKALSDEGIEAEAPFMVMDSVGGGGGYIGELLIPFSHIAGPIVGVIIGAWLQSRSGRKVRVKVGNNEIEATTKEALTTDELNKLLQRLDGEEKAESKEEWITAAEAVRLLKPVFNSECTAKMTICQRAHAGLIRARADRFMVGDRSTGEREVPKDFWWAEGHEALEQNWTTGDFETWIRDTTRLRAFSVSFLRTDIEKMIPSGMAVPGAPEVTPAPAAGGRPRADWWDDLWIEICRQLYVGVLQPKRQGDIERAMMAWLATLGEHPSTNTIRERARKLWAAISKDEN